MINQQTAAKMSSTEFVTKLYQAVDARSIEGLAPFLADEVYFQLANAQPLHGKAAVLDANAAFFKSIAAMSHRIDNVWSQGDDVICNGQVNYTRLDGSHFAAPFATILKLHHGQITNYLIYTDASEL
ncbi:MAG: nuclear transport factor 2 family protein [Cyanobacteria bacterium J06638_20]